MRNDKVRLNLTFPKALKEKTFAHAKARNRTVANFIIRVLTNSAAPEYVKSKRPLYAPARGSGQWRVNLEVTEEQKESFRRDADKCERSLNNYIISCMLAFYTMEEGEDGNIRKIKNYLIGKSDS